MAVPALGGPARTITRTSVGWGLDWSPDGRWLALAEIAHEGETPSIHLHSLETNERRQVTFPGGSHYDRNPVFSADGRRVAFTRSSRSTGEAGQIYVQRLDRPEPVQLTDGDSLYFVNDLGWASDGRSVIFQNEDHLMRASVSGNEVFRLPGTEGALHLAVARNADLLVYAQRREADRDVWRVPGPNADPDAQATALIRSTRSDQHATYSPDGTRIAFASGRSGSDEIWLTDADGLNAGQLTHVGGANMPRWSPDGAKILFNSWSTSDSCNACVIDASGGLPQDAASSIDKALMPGWSADGLWIYVQSKQDADDFRIWRVPADGGPAVRLTDVRGLVPVGGGDGWVYFHRGNGVWRVPHEGGAAESVLPFGGWPEWTLWENLLVYADREDPDGPAIWALDLETGRKRRVTPIEGRTRRWELLSVSPDGRWILYTREDPDQGSDLMRVDNFR
jgi:Tol biopolymer transport system component